MSTAPLGRLQKVELREAWPSEAQNFTPWLAQPVNLVLLGDTIGMTLEPEAREKFVGPFRADILCRDAMSGAYVLIENQLERTDHSHLGQLLTYAAGLDAAAIVWIAERFTDEHRAAMNWLNDKTPDDIGFFGLEIELWRIGTSDPAPKFNVVCRPNEWKKTLAAGRDTSEDKQFCWDYWAGVLEQLAPSGILAPTAKPLRRRDTQFDVGWHAFFLKSYFSRVKRSMAVWVSCRGPSGLDNYNQLRLHSSEIEKRFGSPLEWSPNELKNQGEVTFYIRGRDANDRTDWPEQHKLLAEKVAALYRAVQPFVERLDSQTGRPPAA